MASDNLANDKDRKIDMVKHQERVTSGEDAVSDQAEKNMPLGRAIRRYPKIALYASCVTLAILLWGFDLVVVGTVSSIPAFQMVFGAPIDDRYFVPATWVAVWAISTNIGLMAGAIICGWAQDRIGRRWNLFGSAMIISASVAICYVSDLPPSLNGKRGLFFVAKTIQGFGIGGVMTSTQTWLSEVLPVSLRGPFMALFPIFKLIGQLVGALVCFSVIDSGERSAYRLVFAAQWPFSGLLAVLVLLIPESPAYLIRKGKDAAASKAMLRLRGGRKGRTEEAELAYLQLRRAIDAEKEHSHIQEEGYIACLKPPQLRRTLLICFAEILPILFGLQLLGSSSYFLQQIGMDPELSVLFLIIGIAIGTVASCITFWTMSLAGRRTLILFSMTTITILYTGVGISGAWRGSAGNMWFTAVGFMAVTFVAGIGVWPASYAVASETSALRLRSKSQGLAWVTYGLATLVFGTAIPYLYNPDAGDIGSYTAFVYTGFAGLGAAVTFFCIPEMKGRSAHEIDQMFDLRLPARKFKQWSDSDSEGLT